MFEQVTRSLRRVPTPLALAVVAMLMAFWQRPFSAFSDTRVELATDPSLFLSRALTVWNSTFDLGSVQSSQFVGYAFPIGPFFTIGDLAGLPVWVVQRLWLGGVLAVAAWGAYRIVREFFPERRLGAGFLAGVIFVANPYVLIVLNRGSAWLLAYAALPWLLVWILRGSREPRRWRYPAAFGLTVQLAGPGLNLALVVWPTLAAGLLLLVLLVSGEKLGELWAFVWRAAVCSIALSLWWIAPIVAQVRFGTDYLTFTEHAETILNTPSASESFRLLGYWVSYITGYPTSGPMIPPVEAYLLSRPTILATFLVPAIAVACAAVARDKRSALYFALLLALAVLVMSFGFPAESVVGRAVVDGYYNAGPLQFLRTTYKAAPLAALAIAVLAGVSLSSILASVRNVDLSFDGRQLRTGWLTFGAVASVVILVVLWGRPLWTGNAIDRQIVFDDVPSAWTEALADAQKTTPADTRIAVLPGDLFGWYRWGGTLTSIAPGISERPVLVRQILRAAPPSAAQLLDSVDSRVQQDRLTPGQLPPLLRLMGVGRVLVGSDSSTVRGESIDAARASEVLARQPGFQEPAAQFGPRSEFSPPADRSGRSAIVSQVRAYAAPRPAVPRITRVHPAGGAKIVDGDAEGVVALAGVGALDPGHALFYAGDLSRAATQDLLVDKPTLSFTDSNRRRYTLGVHVAANVGPTLTATEPIDRLFPSYDPFPQAGNGARTVAVYGGIRQLSSPATPSFLLFPEHRPFAALDGDTSTTWIAQSEKPADRYLDIAFSKPLRSNTIQVQPHIDRAGATRQIGVAVNGGAERLQAVTRGRNSVTLGSSPVTSLRIRVIGKVGFFGLTQAGLDEIRIPGVRVSEALRLPTRLASLTSGADLGSVPMQVVIERATADFPRRSGEATGPAFSADANDMADSEQGMRRIVTLPVQRMFTASGWASLRPSASDASIDRLVGSLAGATYTSSSRFEGLGRYRASSAFDGSSLSSWQAEYDPANRPWLQVTRAQPMPVRELKLVPARGRHLKPQLVTVGTPAGSFAAKVNNDGTVRLPRAISTRSLRVTIDRVTRLPTGQRGRHQTRTVAVAELAAAAIPRTPIRRTGQFSSQCGDLSVDSGRAALPMRVSGSLSALDNGEALKLRSCTEQSLPLERGENLLRAAAGPIFAPDLIRLDGAAPVGNPPAPPPAVASAEGKVKLVGRGWLALGQSYSPGWRAWCRSATGRERELGAPVQIDGFANGWRVDGRSCASARFAFGPQASANVGYIASLFGAIFVLLTLLVSIRRWRQRETAPDPTDSEPADIIQISFGSRASSNEIFSLKRVRSSCDESRSRTRTGSVGRAMIVAASVLLVLVGALYTIAAGSAWARVSFDYPLEHMGAHWVALLAALLLLCGAIVCLVAGSRPARTEEAADDDESK